MSRRLPVILTPAEAESLLLAARSACDAARSPSKQLAAWRDFAMVQTALLAGLRVAELCAVQLVDVDLAGAVLGVKLGKGRKDRYVPIGTKLHVVLREWIGDRRDGYLFPGPRARRLSTRTFQVRLTKLATAAGIRKSVHPHLMRHSFACSLLRTGTDIREVQDLMGHASLSTTAVYLHVDVSRLKPACDRL